MQLHKYPRNAHKTRRLVRLAGYLDQSMLLARHGLHQSAQSVSTPLWHTHPASLLATGFRLGSHVRSTELGFLYATDLNVTVKPEYRATF